jgi:antitoxin component of MazEF toxin-antitoxin module
MSVSITRTVDAEGRVVLPPEFIGKTVTLNVVSESEVRVRVTRPRVRPSFAELMSRVTEENLPEKVDFGSPVGDEQL